MSTKFLADARVTFIGTLILALSTIGAGAAVQSMNNAAAYQCANHVWPADSHAVHIDWCTANGYEVR